MALKDQFTAWRTEHPRGTRIPVHLWAAASELVGEYGSNRLARELGLNRDSLKARIAQAQAGQQKKGTAQSPPQFIELVSRSPMTSMGIAPQCMVELTNARGAKMHVTLNDPSLQALPNLCRTFLEMA
jgi:hypothetical protein